MYECNREKHTQSIMIGKFVQVDGDRERKSWGPTGSMTHNNKNNEAIERHWSELLRVSSTLSGLAKKWKRWATCIALSDLSCSANDTKIVHYDLHFSTTKMTSELWIVARTRWCRQKDNGQTRAINGTTTSSLHPHHQLINAIINIIVLAMIQKNIKIYDLNGCSDLRLNV